MSSPAIDLRFELAQLQDAEEISRLVNSAYRGKSSRQGWTTEADYLEGQRTDAESLQEKIQSSRSRIFVLRGRESAEILACVELETSQGSQGPSTYLGMLTVNPKLQAKGLGRTLLTLAEEEARRSGSTRVTLGVIQIRDTLMAWYERRGYRRTGEIVKFPYGDEKFGIPLRTDLHFVMFEKWLTSQT